MDKLKIIRPNGEEEIAELTTDKSLVGNNYLKLDIGGVPHYAKVGDVIETHAYTFNGVDGKKYYIKKEIKAEENEESIEITDSYQFNVADGITVIKISDNVKDRYIKVSSGMSITVEFVWLHVGVDYRWKIINDEDDITVWGTTTLRNKYMKISWSGEINKHETDADLTD